MIISGENEGTNIRGKGRRRSSSLQGPGVPVKGWTICPNPDVLCPDVLGVERLAAGPGLPAWIDEPPPKRWKSMEE